MAKEELKQEDSKPVKTDEMVEISKEDLQGLVSTVHKLQSDMELLKKGEAEIEIPSVKVRRAKVHFYKGNPVVNIGNAWEVADKYGQPELRLEIFVDEGGKKPKKYEVNHKHFTISDEKEGFTVKEHIIKEIKDLAPAEETYGWVDKVEVEYDKFRSIARGKVPLKVVTPKHLYVMEDEKGKVIEVSHKALN